MGFRPLPPQCPRDIGDATPVHTPGSGSDGVTVSPSPAILLQLPGWDLLFTVVSFAASLQADFTDSVGS
jgi:hypothetical protein